MKAIIELQRKIKVTPDGAFGPKSAKAFASHFGLSHSEAAHFLGQCHHESAGFARMEENLNYTAARLLQIFPKYFNEIQAKYYANDPEGIANRVYANRMGNGPELTEDGYKFRGRGPLQLTGRNNYKALAEHFGNGHILTNPDLVTTDYAFESALWFFRHNLLFRYAQDVTQDSILKISKGVNLGNPASTGMPHGILERKTHTLRYFQMLSS